jgi:hypothetical protein
VVVVSEDENLRMRSLGETPDAPVIMNSDGPLKLDVPSVAEYQYIPLDFSEDEYTYPFRIVFKNAYG